jgi:transposase-like protein
MHPLQRRKTRTMHRNAPLTPEGRRRLVLRVEDQQRPVAHVAAEAGIARQTLSKWIGRYRREGEHGLVDRCSVPISSPHRTPGSCGEVLQVEERGVGCRTDPRTLLVRCTVKIRDEQLAWI